MRVELQTFFVVLLSEFLVLLLESGDSLIFELNLLLLFLQFLGHLSEFIFILIKLKL